MTQPSGGGANFICIMIKQPIGTYSQIRGKEVLCIHSPMASCPGENLKKNSFLLSTANNCAIIKRNCKQLCCYQQYIHPTVNSNGEKWLNFYLGA